MLLWGALINKGLRPYRDFWYPYGGFYIQLLRFPASEIWSVIHCTVVLWFFFLGLLRIAGRRLVHALMVFGLVMVPLLLGMMGGWHRYLMPIDVVLLYAAICNVPRLEWKTHLPFAVLVGYVGFCEPPQIVCATGGILVHTGLTALARFRGQSFGQRVAESWRALKQRLLCVGVPMLAGVTASVLVYASTGLLAGIWNFEKSITDQGDYGSVPADIGRWMLPALQPDTVFLLLFLLSGYAAYRWVRMPTNNMQDRYDPLGTGLLVICAAGFVAMQKQIIRPHVMTQVRVYPYVAVLILGLIFWRERKPAARIAIALFLGCIAGIALYQNLPRNIFRTAVMQAPGKVSDTVEVVLHEGRQTGQVNDSLYARSRFIGFDAQFAVVDHLTGACGLQREDSCLCAGRRFDLLCPVEPGSSVRQHFL